MFRNLATVLGGPEKLFSLHPVILHRYLDEAWAQAGFVQIGADTSDVFLGDTEQIVDQLKLPPIAVEDSGLGLPLQRRPWEHLIYAYLLENTGMLRVFRRVVELFAMGEELDVPGPLTRQFLRSTEELIFTDPPPFSIGAVASRVRPSLEVVSRNAYWRLLGMDLDHGPDSSGPWLRPRASYANFVPDFESLFGNVWQNYLNRKNSSGENSSDPQAVVDRAQILSEGLRVRRLRGNLAREEFFFTALFSWFHVVLESDNEIIVDLKATASDPGERLRKLGARVGVPVHPRARSLILLAEPASSLLRFVELQKFNDAAGASTLFAETGAIKDDALAVIDQWSMATGRSLKLRPGVTPVNAAGAGASRDRTTSSRAISTLRV
ncbi:hypothetical protein [Leifsonia sp. NPDC077715]|uniref:hypothetical protein n=1 Tax=Leifsonia sp. NPDC077715 TaxID=3155539 RepID=UPI003444D9CE